MDSGLMCIVCLQDPDKKLIGRANYLVGGNSVCVKHAKVIRDEAVTRALNVLRDVERA